MHVTPIPCLKDNYAYLVRCPSTGHAAVIDPSEAAPVIAAVRASGADLRAILCTHHHADHVGGVEGLLAHFGERLEVYGHESDAGRIPRLSRPLHDGARLAVGDLQARALHIPAHTLGALSYVFDAGVAFTGDTLFVAGCGRLFEGSAAMMYRALNEVLASLPDQTALYPGHEYALNNLRFALEVEPESDALRDLFAKVRARREAGEPCVPTTVAREKATNPFMRVREPAVKAYALRHGARDVNDPIEVLAALRRAKDAF